MARTAQDVTDAELSILQTLWDIGPSPIRKLTAASTAVLVSPSTPQCKSCSNGSKRRAMSSVIVRRMARLRRVREQRRINRPAIAIARRELCGGSMTPLLSHLLQSRPLSPEERSSLRARSTN